jgi:molybdopterin-guanine dinucleotide biosynthesis protein A
VSVARRPAPAPLPPFTGAVLAGGASRRMGRDKALVEVGGRPLAAIAAAALAAAGASPPVLAVGGDAPALARLGLAPVADHRPGEGPLGGILTALAHALHDVVAILACDLPGAHAGAVGEVVAALAAHPEADAAVAAVDDGALQTLHGAWRRSARARVEEAFGRGERAVHRVLADLAVVRVEGIDPGALADADTPGELARGSSKPFTVRHTGRP